MHIPPGLLTLLALGSIVFFPWGLTSVAVLLIAPREPLAPLVVGIVFDMLYWAPGAHAFPVFSLYGLVLSVCAFFVRERLRTSIIR